MKLIAKLYLTQCLLFSCIDMRRHQDACSPNITFTFCIAKKQSEMIANGEIDIGRRISSTLNFPRGSAEELKKKCLGRLMTLENIRQKHLQLVFDHGYLRQTKVESLTLEDCRNELEKRKGRNCKISLRCLLSLTRVTYNIFVCLFVSISANVARAVSHNWNT